MSDEMILSRLIVQVGNKHIVIGRLEGNVSNIINAQRQWINTHLCYIYNNEVSNNNNLVPFLKYRLCLNNRALHFLFSIFSTSTRRYNLTQISYIVSYSCNQAVSSWGMKKFLCANYPTLLPALHLTIQDFYY